MKLTPYILIALAFIGIADTFYLSYFEYMNLIPLLRDRGLRDRPHKRIFKILKHPARVFRPGLLRLYAMSRGTGGL